jgi:hypothetical protein
MEEELPIVHDGDRVREIVEKSTLSFEEFEQNMGWNTTKRYRMFRLVSWNSQQLMQASKVLNHDFFNVYRVWTRNAMKTTTILVPVTVSLPLDFEVVDFGNLEQVFRPAPDPHEK